MGLLGDLGDEVGEGGSWVGRLHEGLANQEASEASLAKFTDGLRIADAALTDQKVILG